MKKTSLKNSTQVVASAPAMNYDGVEAYNIAEYFEASYLNYALYVIKERALPFIGDGLKPVQRRIIYTMAIEGINSAAKKKKSAYTVGQVLGRFHPHGDTACYEAMVIMAQDFSYRYPLICGQGNFGDLFNPSGFAAMRYTESYLSPYANALLSELNSGNVEFVPNYNGDEKEPNYLPARIPNILLNGTSGIAVGMATDIPPHNINEVLEACCALIDNPKLTIAEILTYIKGPDYPSKAEIINSPEELYQIYATGRGAIRQRAVWHQEKDQIFITELPHQAAKDLIVKIADLIQSKKITTIEDIRDDSSETETNVILQLRSSRVNGEELMNQLFVYTKTLEKSQRVNLNMIGINGKPQVKNILQILTEWLEFRKDIVRKRYEHRLYKLNLELNRIAGFLIAYSNLEKVIQIVRNDAKPKEALMKEFALNEEQATAILDLRIRNLAKLEEDALRQQEKVLLKEQDSINKLLASPTKFNAQIKKELQQAAQEYGQERRSPIVYRESAKQVIVEEEIPNEPITVVLSKHGWIRCGKGHDFNLENLTYRGGDSYLCHVNGYLNQPIYFIDSTGRAFSIMPGVLPNMRGYGEAISAHINLEDNAQVQIMLTGEAEQAIVVASTAGYGFVCQLKDLDAKNKAGKSFLALKDHATPLPPLILDTSINFNDLAASSYLLTCISNVGKVVSFDLQDLAVRTKGQGTKLIDIPTKKFTDGEEFLRNIYLTTIDSSLSIKNGSRSSSVDRNTLAKCKSERGNRGKPIIKGLTAKTQIIIKNPAIKNK